MGAGVSPVPESAYQQHFSVPAINNNLVLGECQTLVVLEVFMAAVCLEVWVEYLSTP